MVFPALILPVYTLYRLIETGMEAERQAITGCIDRIDQGIETLALVTHNVEHWAENFAFQLGDVLDLDDRGRNKRVDEGKSP